MISGSEIVVHFTTEKAWRDIKSYGYLVSWNECNGFQRMAQDATKISAWHGFPIHNRFQIDSFKQCYLKMKSLANDTAVVALVISGVSYEWTENPKGSIEIEPFGYTSQEILAWGIYVKSPDNARVSVTNISNVL